MDCNDDTDTRHIRVLPDACVELFINYTSTPVAIIDNQLHKQSIVTFRMSCHKDVQMRKGSGCLAICFYPGVAHRFFQLPMSTLADTTTILNDLWGCMATEVEDRIANAASNTERVAIAEYYLLQKLTTSKADKQIEYSLQKIHRSAGSLSIADLIRDIGITQRHLSRKFQEHVGLSPKEYIKVNRFIQSLQYLKRYPACSLTEIAYESDYYDQAHFIRDYKTYTGYTPREVVHSPHILY